MRSEATISWAYNNIDSGKSKHISIQYGYVWESITNVIIIVYVKSVNKLANSLIKGISRDMLRKTTSGIGLKPVIKDIGYRNPTLD